MIPIHLFLCTSNLSSVKVPPQLKEHLRYVPGASRVPVHMGPPTVQLLLHAAGSKFNSCFRLTVHFLRVNEKCAMAKLVTAVVVLSILSGAGFCVKLTQRERSNAVEKESKKLCEDKTLAGFLECEFQWGRSKVDHFFVVKLLMCCRTFGEILFRQLRIFFWGRDGYHESQRCA